MIPEYIALDTESGGADNTYSLLSLYLAVLDTNFNILGELDLLVKPDDGKYILSGEGMGVNKIDIVEHDKVAITYKEAATKVYEFLNKTNPNGAIKLTPIGHNVAWDIRYVCDCTLSKKSWDKFVGYRCLDTGGVSTYLMKKGTLPQMKASLGTLAEYFGIEFDPHTAKGDTYAAYKVMQKLLEL